MINAGNRDYILVNNQYAWRNNAINAVGEYSDKHLDYMGAMGWLDDNVMEIVNYINNTPSIEFVCFTFKTGGWLVGKINNIGIGVRPGVNCASIFTPTSSGFGKLLEVPFDKRAWSLTHCWVWNGLPHPIMVNKLGYGHLDHGWLTECGVNPNNF